MANASSSPSLFYGEYFHTLDTKKRVTIPARWRSSDPDAVEVFMVVPHRGEACLLVMRDEEFHATAARVEASTELTAAEKRKILNDWFPSARDCAIDKQGRLLLPDEHCQRKGLQGELVLRGSQRRIEIWQKDTREKVRQSEETVLDELYRKAGI